MVEFQKKNNNILYIHHECYWISIDNPDVSRFYFNYLLIRGNSGEPGSALRATYLQRNLLSQLVINHFHDYYHSMRISTEILKVFSLYF